MSVLSLTLCMLMTDDNIDRTILTANRVRIADHENNYVDPATIDAPRLLQEEHEFSCTGVADIAQARRRPGV